MFLTFEQLYQRFDHLGLAYTSVTINGVERNVLTAPSFDAMSAYEIAPGRLAVGLPEARFLPDVEGKIVVTFSRATDGTLQAPVFLTPEELDARFGDTPAEFSAFRRTINQVMQVDANGMPTVLYYFGDTLETSEAVDVATNMIYSTNERGELVTHIATTTEVGRLNTTVENDGEEVRIDSRIMVRRAAGNNAVDQIFAIDATGAINVYFYPSPQTLPNGTQVMGTATVGYISEASRPIYYYDADFNLLTRDGQVVTEGNRDRVVGFAVQRTDISVQLPAELAYLSDRIVVTEEQGYTRLIQTTAQAADLLERLLASETTLNAALRAETESLISRVRAGEFTDVRAVIDHLFQQRRRSGSPVGCHHIRSVHHIAGTGRLHGTLGCLG